MLKYEDVKLGSIIKRELTGQLASVCQIYKDNIYWDSESPCIGLDEGCIKSLEELQEWELVESYIRLPTGRVFEADEHNNVTLSKHQLDIECNRVIVCSYLEQVFMQEGWQEIFEIEDDLVYGLCDEKFIVLDLAWAINHFINDGCPHAIFALVEEDSEE